MKRKAEGQKAEEKEEDEGESKREAPRNREVVAAHYNARPNQDRQIRERSSILGLRRFNNWVKSCQINQHVPPQALVLDLACGKGGDLNKWQRCQPRLLVGVDIAEQSVEQARQRWEEGGRAFPAQFYATDAFGEPLVKVDCGNEHAGGQGGKMHGQGQTTIFPKGMRFDVISCQFAWHYSWESERIARQALSNVSEHLSPHGLFFGTIPNARCLRDRLSQALAKNGKQALSFGNEHYRICFDRLPSEREAFGQRYRFTLADALDDCPEYLISPSYFTKLAAEYNLECLYVKPFAEFYEQQRRDNLPLLRRMQVLDRDDRLSLSEAEWEVATLYSAFCFRKLK